MSNVVPVKSGAPTPQKLPYPSFDHFVADAVELGERYAYLWDMLKRARKGAASDHAGALKLLDRIGRNFETSAGRFQEMAERCARYVELFCGGEDASDDPIRYRQEVAKQVALLIGAYPNGNPADPEIFVRMLIDDIVAAGPTFVVLQAACHKVRRSSRFLPTIAELLEAIEEAEDEWTPRFCAIHVGIDQVRENAEKLRAEVTAEVEKREAAKLAHIEAEKRSAAMFPCGTYVHERKHGIGKVTGHNGSFVIVEFPAAEPQGRTQRLQFLWDKLLAVDATSSAITAGALVVHSNFGRGTVLRTDAYDTVVAFENGGQRTVCTEYVRVLVPNLACADQIDSDSGSTEGRVAHEKFGYGTIVEADGAKLTVDFDGVGRKLVLDSFVQRVVS
jgi:hypothetical protein